MTILVNTAADVADPTDGVMSLREAIALSNDPDLYDTLSPAEQDLVARFPSPPPTGTAPPVPNTIMFALPVDSTVIQPTSALPTITAPIIINGYSQAGSSVSGPDVTECVVNNAVVRIDGGLIPAGAAVDGLAIQAPDCEVSGLIVTGFSGSGVSISGLGSQGNWLWGNFLGALPDPTNGRDFAASPSANLGNAVAGLTITASNNLVGGNTPGLPNIIANNGGAGVVISGAGGTGNILQGNGIFANAAQGVLVSASNNTIGQNLKGGGNSIGGNGAQGVEITGGPDVQGNGVLGNFIGTAFGTPDGQVLKGSIRYPNQQEGIWINDSPKNVIGGYDPNARNVIGENYRDGVHISGPNATGNRLLNNYIGFNIVNGLIAFLPNQNGVSIESPGNFVGVPQAGNTIANNRNHGILLYGSGASGNTVAANVIGLNPDGGSVFRNAFDGIHIDGAPNNIIGGTDADSRNTISGNNNGVYIENAGATGNVVLGNFIGTATDGVTDLGNAVDGVVIRDADHNTIGGAAAGAGNVISGNNRGVRITGASAQDNAVQGNFIGTDLTATRVVPNEIDGVIVTDGAHDNQVGGDLAGAGNTIEFNTGLGVNLDSGTGNAVLGNAIYANTAGGILLNPVTQANNLQPFPILAAITPGGSTTNIQGVLIAAPSTTYTIQFFSSPTRDPSGFGQGQTLIGSAVVTTDAAGNAGINAYIPSIIPSGRWVSATATDPHGNTSQFARSILAVPVSVALGAASYTVSESDGSLAVTVTRSGGQGGAVAVNYAVTAGTATPGVDFTPVRGTLFFNPGDPATKTFTIPILNPHKVGGSVTLNVALSDPAGGATLGTPATAVVTILDNDQPSVQLAPSNFAVIAPGVATFTVVRNSPIGTSTVEYYTSNGTAVAGVNYLPAYGTLTFEPGVTSLTVPVQTLDDLQPHPGPLTFWFTLGQVTGGVPGSLMTAVETLHTVNLPGVFLFSSTVAMQPPGANVATVTVYRAVGATGTVSVAYATVGGNARPGIDYVPTAGTLVFGPGVTSQVVTVPLLNTNVPGADVAFGLTLSNPTGGATLGTIAATAVTITHPAGPRPGDRTPPIVTDTQPIVGPQGVFAVIVSFSKPMEPTHASNPINFGSVVRTPGPDGAFGTPDDGLSTITSAVYDPAARRSVLMLGAPLSLGTFSLVVFNRDASPSTGVGLFDTSGNLLDGTGLGTNPGTPYVATVAAGLSLSYIDRSGDLVSLALTGPGLFTLVRGLDGEAQQLTFYGTAPGASTLTGQLRRPPQGGGTTTIARIAGNNGVNLRLSTPPFIIGGVSGRIVAVDPATPAPLSSDRRATR
jgi:hypothetical protein